MGQGGSLVLKVNSEDTEVYYRASKLHLDMIYKVHNHKYRFDDDGCYRTSLGVISEEPTLLLPCDPEVRFVRSIRDLKHQIPDIDDIEATSWDANDQLRFQKLAYAAHSYDARIVIC